jgi:glucose-1-phosphate thymidylyltransferase
LTLSKAVVLAAGLGKRMQQPAGSEQLNAHQSAAAKAGLKAMIPFARPFLDYSLSRLADAGIRRVCLIIAPDNHVMREYYSAQAYQRIEVSFAFQQSPRGTAHALLSAEEFVAQDDFLCINGDTLYPASALKAVRGLATTGTAGFQREDLVKRGNIPEARVKAFAVMVTNPDGRLKEIVEKPTEAQLASWSDRAPISMNCWRFNSTIFRSCRNIPLSARGELEIPSAVMHSIEHQGCSYQVIACNGQLLDLSCQEDIRSVEVALRDQAVNL